MARSVDRLGRSLSTSCIFAMSPTAHTSIQNNSGLPQGRADPSTGRVSVLVDQAAGGRWPSSTSPCKPMHVGWGAVAPDHARPSPDAEEALSALVEALARAPELFVSIKKRSMNNAYRSHATHRLRLRREFQHACGFREQQHCIASRVGLHRKWERGKYDVCRRRRDFIDGQHLQLWNGNGDRPCVWRGDLDRRPKRPRRSVRE
jgi:hypothetical protein